MTTVPCGGTVVHMVASWRDGWLRAFFEEDQPSKRIPSDLTARLFRKLQMLDDSTTEGDLLVPPSNHFEHLKGDLKGLCSIRVKDQWRLVFEWANGEADRVILTIIHIDKHPK